MDPGHPPIGATGPTGLYEPVPTLAIGLEVKRLLEAEGATVVMTRSTADPVPLYDRPIMARRANAQALVSIHLNALPDGVNPFVSNGTGAYYFLPQAIGARARAAAGDGGADGAARISGSTTTTSRSRARRGCRACSARARS